MANPLANEKEIYEKIEKEKLTIHPIIWELINHHIRNDLNYIILSAHFQCETPRWILKFASFMIAFLYRISFQPGDPPPPLLKTFEGIANRVTIIDKFLKNLYQKTYPK
ncbi:MAG: hypothetical protein QXZ20_02840 [Candidatus Aenigmatarchaeota archaeon]